MAHRVDQAAGGAIVRFACEFSTREVLRVIVSNSCLQRRPRHSLFPHIPLD
jgi:hypothetical protein